MKQSLHHLTLATMIVGGCVFSAMTSAYGDTLEGALRAALANSKTLAAARQGWVATREAIGTKTSTSDLSARFNTTGTFGYVDTRGGDGFERSQSIAAGVTVSKNLYDGGQTAQNMRLAEIELQSASANYTKTEQAVILQMVEAYLAVIKARREVQLHEANLRRLDAHVAAAKIRVEAGATTPTRLAEARARLARAKSDSISAQTRLTNAEDSYRSLTGVDAGPLEQPRIGDTLPATLLDAETIARTAHPDVIVAQTWERAADQAFNTLKAAVSPTVGFSLSANSKAASGTSADKDEVTAQVVFSTPILSTNATRSSARRIAATYNQSKLKHREAVRAVEVAARQAFRNWQATQTRLVAVKTEIDASRLVARGIASEAQYGQKTTLDLLDAEQDVNDAELRLVTVEHDQLQAGFRLLAAIGRLSADDIGLADVMGSLTDMPAPQDPFSTTFPFKRRQPTE